MNQAEKWAVITGASSGIGKALALEFASGGFNVFLTGRSAEALNAVAEECVRESRVRAEVQTADLSNESSIDALIRVIAGKQWKCDVLVNNAGFGIHGDRKSTRLNSSHT